MKAVSYDNGLTVPSVDPEARSSRVASKKKFTVKPGQKKTVKMPGDDKWTVEVKKPKK